MKPRLLVLELHHLGDAVMAFPFLQAAREQYEVTVFCQPVVAKMLATFLPGLDLLKAGPSWNSRLLQVKELRALAPAVTVCAWSDTRAHLLARLSGAPRRVGFPANEKNFYGLHLPWRQRRLRFGRMMEDFAQSRGKPLLTDPLNRVSPKDSHLKNWLQLAAHLGLIPRLQTSWFDLPAGNLPEKIHSFISEQKTAARPLWVLHPGGRLPTKRWPIERYQTVLETWFTPRNLPVLIIEAPGEEAPNPASALQRKWPVASHTELAALLQQADFVLCNDSYPAHLAAALGKKVFTIFGSGNPDWFAPFENADRVIARDICPAHPCIDRCVMPDFVCLKAVYPAQVIAALEKA